MNEVGKVLTASEAGAGKARAFGLHLIKRFGVEACILVGFVYTACTPDVVEMLRKCSEERTSFVTAELGTFNVTSSLLQCPTRGIVPT